MNLQEYIQAKIASGIIDPNDDQKGKLGTEELKRDIGFIQNLEEFAQADVQIVEAPVFEVYSNILKTQTTKVAPSEYFVGKLYLYQIIATPAIISERNNQNVDFYRYTFAREDTQTLADRLVLTFDDAILRTQLHTKLDDMIDNPKKYEPIKEYGITIRYHLVGETKKK